MAELIALCPNPFRDNGLELTKKAAELLNNEGFDTVICPVFGENEEGSLPEDVVISDWEAVKSSELIIIIGGDGTILHTARMIDHIPKPLLGVNLGTKGFMASLEPEELELIVDAARGKYINSCRMMAEVMLIRNGKIIYSECGLNDVVIHGMGDCIKIIAWADADRVMSFNGDGIIVATPTGSTGYSMSAGGPIIEPEANSMIITPICAHVIGAKVFVLNPERTIKLEAEKIHDRRAFLSVDGAEGIEIHNGDVVLVRRSEKTMNLVRMGTKSFYDSTFEKLLYKNS
ncbi:MAG: NAD(+)/NADH kinase [Oscillospiraceae bacterium]|mgnify:CR=1 FL=1|nr:NAD(+)/NADH kinase [Oscillospiraceae bacterium]